MTESELRKTVASIMLGWVGGKQGSAIHKEILKIWNDYAKKHGLPQAYESYAWCAETASAAYIKAGIGPYVPLSLSCGQLIEQAKKLGIWIENDAHVPKIGDEVIYGWDAPKTGDALGKYYHDHVGIVVSVGKDTFSVVEGNAGSPSQARQLTRSIDFRYISGFICPDFKTLAKKLTPAASKTTVSSAATSTAKKVTETAKKIEISGNTYTVKKGDTLGVIAEAAGTTAAKLGEINGIKDLNKISTGQVIKLTKDEYPYKAAYKKTWTVTAERGLNVRSKPDASSKGNIILAMSPGVKCTCDGYYKKVGSTVWLRVTYQKKTGWATKTYLK